MTPQLQYSSRVEILFYYDQGNSEPDLLTFYLSLTYIFASSAGAYGTSFEPHVIYPKLKHSNFVIFGKVRIMKRK